jgi:hypothetical protein
MLNFGLLKYILPKLWLEFGGDEGEEPQVTQNQPMYPGYSNAMNTMGNVASQQAGTLGTPYGGSLTAAMSPTQQSAQNLLSQFSGLGGAYTQNWAQNPIYQQAQQNMMYNLSGQGVTGRSPQTEALYKIATEQTLPEAQAGLHQALARTGGLHGYGAGTEEARLQGDTTNYLNAIFGQQAQNERNVQNQFTQMAPSWAQAEYMAPAQQYETLMSLGQAGQTQQQNELNAQYQEFMRQRQEQLYPVQQAQSASQIYPSYTVTPGEAGGGGWADWAAPIGGLLGGGVGAIFGNPLLGAQIGSAAGGFAGQAGGSTGQAQSGLQLADYLNNWKGAFSQPGYNNSYWSSQNPSGWGVD